MKQLFTLLALMTLSIATLMAQTPDLINYQAVARDGNGDIMANQSINVTFIIHSGSAAGPVEFEEDHTSISTNDFGLFTLQIGSGANVSGSIDGIDWGADSHYLEVEVNGASVGTQQLVSVPYALEAGGPWSRNGSDLLYSQGDVGIGAAPAFNLQVTSASDMAVSATEVDGRNAHVHLRNTSLANGTMVGIGFGVSTVTDLTGGAIVFERTGTDSEGKLHFATRDAVQTATPLPIRMTIDSDGFVGVGTTTPQGDFHIEQSSASVTGTGGLFNSFLGTYWKLYHSGTHYSFADDGTRVAYVEGTTGNYVQPSDSRLKSDILGIGSVMNNVMLLKPVSYKYSTFGSDAARTTGFLAQDVAEVFPGLVKHGEDGELGLSYSEFSVIAIKAIQEQQTQMETMQAEIEALKQKLEKLMK